jgi:hypothetical protein
MTYDTYLLKGAEIVLRAGGRRGRAGRVRSWWARRLPGSGIGIYMGLIGFLDIDIRKLGLNKV